ncbi:unnamed protein product [Spirodela intermedia]|uniref:SS18 N-terminal domain-containing protein n=2 Tax=Spirodela intermedia TaxID=51605 RepID=A0A7I8JAX0_SPIIN|nr:unnamed protein product [Spirodela intermedia]CAA6667249.1 unnamed protein product [Spirodela intermedia]CAA7404073.1 unnamed protein product [Spirodela intermedia]
MQQHQHLMQQNPMMAFSTHPSNVTSDLIQQYLDENKQLILAILENQNSGKVDECAANQAKLQRNLMYLAAVADSQPQAPTMSQFPSNTMAQSGGRYIQPQQAQVALQTNPESLMVARSPMQYSQSSMPTFQQQALHSQLGMSSGGNNGLHMLYGDAGMVSGGGSGGALGGFPDFSRGRTAAKQEMPGSVEGRGGSSGGQSGDGTEPLYMKGSEDRGN